MSMTRGLDPMPSDAALLRRKAELEALLPRGAHGRVSWVGDSVADMRLGPDSPLAGKPPTARQGTESPKTSRADGPSEKQVEAAGDRLMAAHGFVAVRFSQARATNQSPGIPDRKYFHAARGLAVWWEAKAPGGKQRPAQREFQLMAEAVGETYLLGGTMALTEWLARPRGRRVCR